MKLSTALHYLTPPTMVTMIADLWGQGDELEDVSEILRLLVRELAANLGEDGMYEVLCMPGGPRLNRYEVGNLLG